MIESSHTWALFIGDLITSIIAPFKCEERHDLPDLFLLRALKLAFLFNLQNRPYPSLPGATSRSDRRTYPKIAIRNFSGDAVLVASAVTASEPHFAHPHKLRWREGKTEKGVCSANISVSAGLIKR